jgi:hypothetical protein
MRRLLTVSRYSEYVVPGSLSSNRGPPGNAENWEWGLYSYGKREGTGRQLMTDKNEQNVSVDLNKNIYI